MNERSTILVVEDDLLALEAITDVLEIEGYNVVSASDGQEGLERLHTSTPPPSLVLLDLGLPIIDGWEFLRRQKNDPKIAHVPVVILTATPSPHVPAANAVLKKPVSPSNLLKAITRYR
jgi:two-component system chemotaxis response regulator CheY